MMTHITIPPAAARILEILENHGFEAYVVGGCVRDSLLGRTPDDWDITTSARPEEVKQVFRRTIDTGIQHGTVTVLMNREGFEVTTYRIDGEYEDGRHPKEVIFTPNLREDLARRDFTINAMAYSPRTGLVDIFGGLEDMKNRRITCVGKPMDRFTEDALRILRAIRFAAQLDFTVEAETKDALARIAPNLVHVSKERILAELTKALLSLHPEKLLMIRRSGMDPYICEDFPEIFRENDTFSPEDGLRSRLESAAGLPKERHFRFAALLAALGEEKTEKVLRELRSDNDTIKKTRALVRHWADKLPETEAELRKLMSTLEDELFDDVLRFRKTVRPSEGKAVRRLERLAGEIRQRGDCYRLKELAVTGADLKAAGIPAGPKLGAVMNRLLEEVLEEPERNEREGLLKRAEELAEVVKPVKRRV